jgi:prolycopene isomerase
MIDVIEKEVKGLSKHIRVTKIFTPEDLNDFSLAQKGAMYGWKNTPSKSLKNRLQQRTLIKNPFFSVHWTLPGSGVTTSIISGWMVSREINRV